MEAGALLILGYLIGIAWVVVWGVRKHWPDAAKRALAWGSIPMAVMVSLYIGLSLQPKEQAAQVAVAAPAPLAVPQPPKWTKPRYVIREKFDYGYEIGKTEQDRRDGVAARKIKMVRFLGILDGVYQIAFIGDGASVVFESKPPFTIAVSYGFVGITFVNKEFLSLETDALAAQVFQDAEHGALDPYYIMSKSAGKMMRLWVDGEAKKLRHIPAPSN